MPTVNITSLLKHPAREIAGRNKLTRVHSGLPRPRNAPHVWLSHRHTPTDTATERVSGPSTRINDRGDCLAGGKRFAFVPHNGNVTILMWLSKVLVMSLTM